MDIDAYRKSYSFLEKVIQKVSNSGCLSLCSFPNHDTPVMSGP